MELEADGIGGEDRQDNRAHLIAPLPFLTHCSAVPRWF
jgi:hypothetical protein